jgi:SAM-dependent methyltransferase
MGVPMIAWYVVNELKKQGLLDGCKSIIELGSQNLFGRVENIERYLRKITGKKISRLHNVAYAYAMFGIDDYHCIDADGRNGAFVFDLNKNIRSEYDFEKEFDIVTNFGTAEHCFNQHEVFRNMHELCRPGGIIIGGYPIQGFINHGYYQYSPKMLIELALANDYDILGLYLSPARPEMYYYSPSLIDMHRDDDLDLWTVFRLSKDKKEFRTPFDSSFLDSSDLGEYASLQSERFELFSPLVYTVSHNQGRYSSIEENGIDLADGGIEYRLSDDPVVFGCRKIPSSIIFNENEKIDSAFDFFAEQSRAASSPVRVLIVVDNQGKFIGVISMGDIQGKCNITCGEACNKNAVTLREGHFDNAFSLLSKKITQIPVLDEEGYPVNLYGLV